MLNKQPRTADRGGPPAWRLVKGLRTVKKETVTNPLDKPRNRNDSLVRCMVVKLGLSP